MDYNDFIFLVWWLDFTTAKKMGTSSVTVKGIYLNEEVVALRIKKIYLSRNEAFSHVSFQKEREKTIVEFLSPLYL